jgi:hypothetical protein|tara:strand:+ start:181 stop:561 length:381 start_codon:yes stop_codon:yes gene_type:complete
MMQLSVAPGFYAFFLFLPYPLIVNFDSHLWAFVSYVLALVSLYFDRSLRDMLKEYIWASVVFYLDVLFFSVIPVLSVFFAAEEVNFSIMNYVVLVGGIGMFIFLAFFHTKKRLMRHGWTNLSGQVN